MGFALPGPDSAPDSPSSPLAKEVEASSPPFSALIADVLFTFDSGNTISYLDGTGNIFCGSSTGRGKTSSVINPCINNLIRAGYGGIIIDIKGNCADSVRLIARNAGREADILELGTASTATPINLLQGLSLQDINRFLMAIGIDATKHATKSLDWLLRGVKMASDIVQLLLFLSEYDDDFTPTISLLKAMTHDYKLAHATFKFFMAYAYDETRMDHVDFAASINGKTMHPLCETQTDHDWLKQIEWNIQDLQNALSSIAQDQDINRNFASFANPEFALDF